MDTSGVLASFDHVVRAPVVVAASAKGRSARHQMSSSAGAPATNRGAPLKRVSSDSRTSSDLSESDNKGNNPRRGGIMQIGTDALASVDESKSRRTWGSHNSQPNTVNEGLLKRRRSSKKFRVRRQGKAKSVVFSPSGD